MKNKCLSLIVSCLWVGCAMAQTGEYKCAFKNGEKYKYNATGKDVSVIYAVPFFEDSPFYTEDDWKDGYGILGYGESYINTQCDFGGDPANKVITTYIITSDMSFDYNGVEFDSLFLKVKYDDAFVAYINGVEVARRNLLPVTTNSGTATEDHEAEQWEMIDITPFKASIITQGSFFAAEVHQNSKESDDLAFGFEVIYYKKVNNSPISTVTRKPYLMLGTPTSVEVRWQTSKPTGTSLSYGSSALTLDKSYEDTTSVTEHKALITGLEPDSKYFYEVNNEPSFLNDVDNQFFHTNPVAGTEKPYRFWVLGDFGDGSPNQVAVLANYTLRNLGKFTDGWLWLGDNAYSSGTQGEYQTKVFNIYSTVFRNTMLYPSPGNHDLGSADAATSTGPYFENFDVFTKAEAGGVASNTEAYYSCDYGNIHFVSLESTQLNRKPTGDMATWLAKDLATNKQKWTIAYWHHPPYSKGSHNSDTEGNLIEMREYILPILEQYGVDLVMCGHSHTYERSFLLDRHYGLGSSLSDSNLVQGHEDGRIGSDGPYLKPIENNYSHKGTVYFVNGTGGSLSTGEAIDHPAVYKAIEQGGSVILEINGDTLTSTFINAMDPTNDDQFTIIKSKNEPCAVSLSLGDNKVISNGDSAKLDAGNEYLSYLWNTGETSSVIYAKTPGTYICTVGVSESCKTSDTVIIDVNYDAAVNLGPDTIICRGTALVLNAGSVFKEYSWSTGATTSSISVTESGTYGVTVTANNNTVASDSVVVIVKDYPVNTINTTGVNFPENSTVNFNAGGTADTFEWNFGDFGTASGSSVSHTFPIAGVYNVVLTSANAHCASQSSKSITIYQDTTGVGIEVQVGSADMGLLIFPNPADETITVKIGHLEVGDVDVKIYSETGKLMYDKVHRKGLNIGENEFSIDVDDWADGLYHMVASNAKQSSRTKFIIGGK